MHVHLSCRAHTDPRAELSGLLLNIKEEHTAIAPVLRVAVWNWVDQHPEEFNETIRTRGSMEGAPERMFDLLHSLSTTPESNKRTWPGLAVLNCISPDRVSPDLRPANSNRAKALRPVRVIVIGLACVS
jgi:hypothetical protein